MKTIKNIFSLTHMYYYTGGFLFLTSLIYLFKQDITSFFSWAIFGCMYLVMDSYTPKKNCKSCTKKETYFCCMRHTFGIIGVILSASLFLYVIFYT